LLNGIDLSSVPGGIPGVPGIPGGGGGTGGPGTGGPGVGGGGGGGFASIVAGLSDADRQTLKNRCLNVLANPERSTREQINFCRMVASL
jgi:hypothetical protein